MLRHDPSLHSADPGVRSEPLLPHGRSVSGNLPTPLARLFGRDTELAQIDATLRNERLVVLTGRAGSARPACACRGGPCTPRLRSGHLARGARRQQRGGRHHARC